MKTQRKSFSVGDRFGRLVVVEDLGTVNKYGVYARRLKCRCDCGKTKVSWAAHLRAGDVKSCGCLYQSPQRHYRLPEGEAAFRFVLHSYENNAKNRGLQFLVGVDELRALFQKPCHYCGEPPSTVAETRAKRGKFTYNGLDRVDNSKGYVLSNVVPCCASCNYAKRDRSREDFLDWVRRVYERSVAGENDVRIVF